MEQIKWEYKQCNASVGVDRLEVRWDSGDIEPLDAVLESWGLQGWELVSVTGNKGGFLYAFKRPLG